MNVRESPINERVVIEHDGKQMKIPALARATGLSYQTIYWRWNHGLRGDALIAPVLPRALRNRKRFEL